MFKTLDDYKNKNDDKKKKTADSYAGGEKSGLAIENPDDLNGIIEKATKEGQNQQSKREKNETNCKVSLYQNGFTIDDGEFRPYDNEQNKKFMNELNQGNVPTELRQKFPNGLYVGLEDRRSEKFRLPTPPKYIAYSGQGTTMNESQVTSVAKEVNLNAKLDVIVDANKPKTTIQIRLHNGKTSQVTLNVDSRVSQLFDYVNRVAPVDGSFQILCGFPPKPITNKEITLEEAGLIDESVIQRLA